MARLNISVPDALAEQVRSSGVVVSQVCQRALTGAVGGVSFEQQVMAALARIEGRLSALEGVAR